MLGKSRVVLCLGMLVLSGTAAAEPAAPPTAAPPTAQPPAAQPPAAQPPALVALPPGYMLVPIPGPNPKEKPQRVEIPYEEGDPVPPGYRVATQPRRGLVIAGSIVTGVPWLLSAAAAGAANYEDGTAFLLIPALGPWLTLATRSANDDECEADRDSASCAGNVAVRAILVMDAIVQTAGVVMFISGFAFPRKRLVQTHVTVGAAPVRVGRDGYGLGLVAAF